MTTIPEAEAKVVPVNPSDKDEWTAGTRLSRSRHEALERIAARLTRALGRRFTKADVIACYIEQGLDREAA